MNELDARIMLCFQHSVCLLVILVQVISSTAGEKQRDRHTLFFVREDMKI